MSFRTLTAMFATVAASFAAPMIVQAAQEKPMQTAMPKPNKSGHAAVNGVNYYYAVYGTGELLLLLHGGMRQIEVFGPNLTKLAQSRQVIESTCRAMAARRSAIATAAWSRSATTWSAW